MRTLYQTFVFSAIIQPSMRRSRSLLFLVPIFFLVFAGFGCKKRTTGTLYPVPSISGGVKATTTPPVYVKDPNKPKDQEPGLNPDIVTLRQVMKNLVAAQSFRAKMLIPTEEGQMNGDIEFARGKGLHGVLNLPNQSTTEIYLMGNDILFRANTSSWTNLAFTPEGVRMAALFSSAFSLQGAGTTSTISDSARMTSITDDPSGCKLYVFQQPVGGTGLTERVQICVKDNLPMFFRVRTQAGDVEVAYRDFNQKIDIIRPVK